MRAVLITLIVMTAASLAFAQGKSQSPDVLELKADTLLGRQDYAGALKIYNQITSKSKKVKDEIYYKRAFASYNLGDFESALRDINTYLANHSEVQARALRAYIYQELGDYDNQLKDISAIMEGNPNPELLRWRASVAMEAEQYDLARNDIKALLAINPDPEVESYLALTYYYQGKPDSALLVLNKVIRAKPEMVQAYGYAGSMLLEEAEYDLALEYINQGLAHEPSNASLIFYKGIALTEKKDLEEGCRCLYKAFTSGMDDAADYLKEYCYQVTE